MAGNKRFFRKVISGDRQSTQLQTNIEQAVSQVIKNPLIDGRLINSIQVSTTGTRIEHKLGRAPAGYLVIYKNSAAIVHDNLDTETKPEFFITLTASVDTLLGIWIF